MEALRFVYLLFCGELSCLFLLFFWFHFQARLVQQTQKMKRDIAQLQYLDIWGKTYGYASVQDTTFLRSVHSLWRHLQFLCIFTAVAKRRTWAHTHTHEQQSCGCMLCVVSGRSDWRLRVPHTPRPVTQVSYSLATACQKGQKFSLFTGNDKIFFLKKQCPARQKKNISPAIFHEPSYGDRRLKHSGYRACSC